MSDYVADSWADNPFAFTSSRQIPNIVSNPVPLSPILRDAFEKLKSKYIKMPPAKINPLEPVGTRQWSPEMGMSQTLTDRFAPNPAFIGLPLRREEVPTQVGTKGFNTHYNICLDQSSSMKSNCTVFEGTKLHRGLVVRLATACLISQASINLDSFTVYSYNNSGKIVWPIPDGEPSFEYSDAVSFLTSDGAKSIWNPMSRTGKLSAKSLHSNRNTNDILNALDAVVPDGNTNHDHAFEVLIENSQKHDISGMTTLYMTDGDDLGASIIHSSSVSGGKPYDEWLRQYGHVIYVILRSEKEQRQLEENINETVEALMKLYDWPRNVAQKFVRGFPDSKMIDPETGEAITDVMDQISWLFTDIGKIFSGTSEAFEDIADYYGHNTEN
jgi:hypothetical protein